MPKLLSVADLSGGGTVGRFEGRHHGAKVSFFVGHFAAGRGPRLHRHPYEETFIVEEGSATFTVDGETMEATAGHIVVVPAGAAHLFVAGEAGLRQVSIHPVDRMVQEWVEG